MKDGRIVLASFPCADGRSKERPALVLRELPPNGELLICAITTQLQQAVPGWDEIIRAGDPDFPGSGLRADSLIRPGHLVTLPRGEVRGSIGAISAERHRRILARVARAVFCPPQMLRRVLGIIPARYGSTRFPGKPLARIAGKPLLQHVVERCRQARALSELIVATDDPRIADVASRFVRVEMTRPDHPSGTDRVAEVAARCDCDAVVNIQGDEPLMEPSVVDAVAGALRHSEMATAATPLRRAEDFDNPNVVKVVVSRSGRALYFSRRTIPYLREAAGGSVSDPLAAFPFLKHLGIYGYRRETLLRLVQLPPSSLEQAERLEQLRALENDIPIAVVPVEHDSVGVDTPEDAARIERRLAAGNAG